MTFKSILLLLNINNSRLTSLHKPILTHPSNHQTNTNYVNKTLERVNVNCHNF